jgi:acrylyl-CoA reductase (NADPH)
MQCIMHLEEHAALHPSKGEVLVTGAAGGLGGIAVAILSQLGYTVVASSGRAESLDGYLRSLGAARVIGRLVHDPARPLGEQLWAGCVDSVGGDTLAAVLGQTKYRCGVASTGVAGGGELNTSVYPLILRGIRLLGVDSTLPYNVEGYPAEDNEEWLAERMRIWARLDTDLDRGKLHLLSTNEIGLSEVREWSETILRGGVQGRIVVDVDK